MKDNSAHKPESSNERPLEDNDFIVAKDDRREILEELLKQIKAVDFRKASGLSSQEKISRKVALVIGVDEVLKVAKKNGWGLAFCEGSHYVYNGNHWITLSEDDVKFFLYKALEYMGYNKLEAKHYEFRDALFKQFVSTAQLPSPSKDPTKVLINLKNGTMEIPQDGEPILRKPNKKDFLKYQLSFAYNPKATCPQFFKFLDQMLPDKECQAVLAEFLGYVFITGMKLEKVLVLYGGGSNGKGVIFEIMNALLGSENVSNYSLESLTKSDSYQRAEIGSKLLNYVSEIKGNIEADNFKKLASGEPIDARRIYGRPFIMTNYAKIICNCNRLPAPQELTEGFFRRFIILPFDVTIKEADKDIDLAQRIISSELAGIFNWILSGLRRLRQNRNFTQAKEAQRMLDEYRKESDSVAMFIEDRVIEKSTTIETPVSELYRSYSEYCGTNGYMRTGNKTFSSRLKSLGFQHKKKNNGSYFYCTSGAMMM